MTARRTMAVSLAVLGLALAAGRALPRAAVPTRRDPASATPPPVPIERPALARSATPPTLGPTPDAQPAQPIDAILAELPAIHDAQASAGELVVVRYHDGRVRAYRPEDLLDGGGEGGRVVRRRMPDRTWEEYDPVPQIVDLAGAPDDGGLVTLPDGTRVRWVFTTDGGE